MLEEPIAGGGSRGPHAEHGQAFERFRRVCLSSDTKRALLRLLLAGRSRKQIAEQLGRSKHTIDGHFKELYAAIGVGDRAQLVLFAAQLRELACESDPTTDSSRNYRPFRRPPPEMGG